jgi:hypothetical protein
MLTSFAVRAPRFVLYYVPGMIDTFSTVTPPRLRASLHLQF